MQETDEKKENHEDVADRRRLLKFSEPAVEIHSDK